jgi:hypothetical protein
LWIPLKEYNIIQSFKDSTSQQGARALYPIKIEVLAYFLVPCWLWTNKEQIGARWFQPTKTEVLANMKRLVSFGPTACSYALVGLTPLKLYF